MVLRELLSRLRKPDTPPGQASVSRVQTHATKALSRFLAGLGAREQPILLDLGSVVGSNVTFFGEHLGCKIFVEDLARDIDRHVREGRLAELPDFLSARFPQQGESFDGIVCWDIFDYLDRPAGQALAREIVRLLRPDGVVLAFFNHTERPPVTAPTYTRHVVVDQRTLEHKAYEAARGKQRPFLNRDIQRMFEPLTITEQFLLKTNMRELVFRKGTAKGN
jgi:cyclopropane fatty-acyl-phospholipid synthase-like methyltransferase